MSSLGQVVTLPSTKQWFLKKIGVVHLWWSSRKRFSIHGDKDWENCQNYQKKLASKLAWINPLTLHMGAMLVKF